MKLNDLESIGQSEKQKQIAAHTRSLVEKSRASASRMALESIWMRNIAYLCGFDGVTFSSLTRSFHPINKASSFLRKNRIHVNKILPTVQIRLAKMCKSKPKYDVRPNTSDTEDKDAARLALQVLNFLWDKNKLDAKRIPLYMWMQQCGISWMKVVWDDTLGEIVEDPATGEKIKMGDVRFDVVSAFEVFFDPAAKSEEEIEWIIQAKVRKLDYFKTHYPEYGHLVKEEDVWLMSLQYEQKVASMNNRSPGTGTQDQIKDSAIELIKYEKPSLKYPNGRMIVTAGDVVLVDKELPCGQIPLVMFSDIVVGGKLYAESVITHMVPIQDQYNELIRKRSEWTNKNLTGKFIAARGSALAQEAMNDQSGEIVYFTPVPNAPNGGAPMAMNMPVIPQYSFVEEERLNEMFNYISGISEVSRGNLPSASLPAIGAALLVESDDTRIGVETEQHEHAWAKVGEIALKYVSKYYQLPRKLKIAGKNLEYAVKEFVGDDLKNSTDVIVIRGSTLPGSKTVKRQEIIQYYQMGLLGDPQDNKTREKVLSMLEFGDVAEAYEDNAIDEAQIQRGIELIEKGEDVPINKMDNNALWVLKLNRLRKSDRFETLAPEAQALVEAQIEQRIDAIVDVTNMVPKMPPSEPPTPPPGMLGDMAQPSPLEEAKPQLQSANGGP